MRSCLNPVIQMCQKYKVTTLIIAHANKRKGAYGRNRLADSSDLWDISRAVLLNGQVVNKAQQNSGKKLFYISPEKNNYGSLQESVLFHIENGKIIVVEHTWKHDREFMQDYELMYTSAPKRDAAEGLIVDYLKSQNGSAPVKEVENYVLDGWGISKKTLRNAKANLSKEKIITISCSDFGGSWTMYLCDQGPEV